MKNNMTFILLFSVFFLMSPLKVFSDWYAFDVTKTMNASSPVNIGKQVLDAPAGKHGFLERDGSNFRFEDGTSATFWGTNLCFSACFPSKQEAEKMAERLAFFGFNAVRLHHMDFYFEAEGIFEDVDWATQNPQQKRTGFLSDSQLDKLDYLISQLKARGIYIDLNLLVSRHFTEADGVVAAAELGIAAKPASYFDARLKELQKQYSEALLKHYNPYTGLNYCDDPAISIVEIVNENSLMSYWKWDCLDYPDSGSPETPEYYLAQLDSLWNNWLEEKYVTPQNVAVAWGISQGTPTETVISQDGANWQVETQSGAACQKSIVSGNTQLQVTAVTGTSWHVQYRTHNLNLSSDKTYIITFKAKADKNLSATLIAQQYNDPWDGLGLTEVIALTPSFTSHQVTFIPTINCSDAKIGFLIGSTTGVITLQDLQITERDGSLSGEQGGLNTFDYARPKYRNLNLYDAQARVDIRQFYLDLEKSFFTEMTSFLKNTCHVKVPVTGIGGPFELDDMEAQNECDYLDNHTYWDHPYFPNGWSYNAFIIENTSTLGQADFGIIGDIKRHYPAASGQPYTVTEWNHCYPNPYAYETPLLVASEAVKNGWDGLYQFAFSQGGIPLSESNIYDWFDTSANPQQMVLSGAASLLYKKISVGELTSSVSSGVLTLSSPLLKGAVGNIKNQTKIFDMLQITAAENGTALIYSSDDQPLTSSGRLVLIAVGEVKNTGSGWVNGAFNWGTGPTLLKAVPLQVIVTTEKNVTVYPLDNTGSRLQAINAPRQGNAVSFSTANISSPWFEIVLEEAAPDAEAPAALEIVSPAGSSTISGDQGGPFSPASITYTICNSGTTALQWTASKTASWASLSKASGTLGANETDSIVLTLGSAANLLSVGTYSCTANFFNATNGTGNATRMITLNVTQPPLAAPLNVCATDGTSTDEVAISWNASAGATYYSVYRAGSAAGEKTLLGSTADNVFHDTLAVAGLTYYYFVKSNDGSRESVFSLADAGYRQEKIGVPAITDLKVYSYNRSSVRLNWTTPAGSTTLYKGYDIRYSASLITESNWASAKQVRGEPLPGNSGAQVLFNIRGLSAQTKYYFAAKTFNAQNAYSELSNVISITTSNTLRSVFNIASLKTFNKIQDAYNDNSTESGDIFKCQNTELAENVSFSDGKSISIEGGLDDTYTTTAGITSVQGNMEVMEGEVNLTNGEIHFITTSGEIIFS